jgi:hypothetical protein
MHRVPLVLGLMALAAGIAMVGFGVPINEFGLGNTLIDAGTTAIVGGLVLLGLWAATVELGRLARELGARPQSAGTQLRPPPRTPPETQPEPGRAATRVQPQPPAEAAVKPASGVSSRRQLPAERDAAGKTFEAIWPLEEPAQEASEERSAEQEDGAASTSPAILKSGVISGMAYTLYTDGSIEAELRRGTIRFGSIDELRAYLSSNPSG